MTFTSPVSMYTRYQSASPKGTSGVQTVLSIPRTIRTPGPRLEGVVNVVPRGSLERLLYGSSVPQNYSGGGRHHARYICCISLLHERIRRGESSVVQIQTVKIDGSLGLFRSKSRIVNSCGEHPSL